MNLNWNPPGDWIKITTIDSHAAGEPLRVIADGLPPIPGSSILAKRRYLKENLDFLRTSLMWEPRGHADMYGAIVTEPVTSDGDVGVLFLHNEGYSTMCGHGIIALTTVLLDTEWVQKSGNEVTLRMDTPAGRVTARARREGGRVKDVSFLNVPSFVYAHDQVVSVPGVGPLHYDLAFGGAFYAFVRAEDLSVGLEANDFRTLIDLGMRIKKAVMENLPIQHPFEDDLGFLYGTIIVGKALDPAHHSRNVCIFADGEVDRSPTGTGVSARAAIHFSRGELSLGEYFTVESILGTCFSGRIIETTKFGPFSAVVPEITGTASIVGRSEWWIDPADPLRYGFMLR